MNLTLYYFISILSSCFQQHNPVHPDGHLDQLRVQRCRVRKGSEPKLKKNCDMYYVLPHINHNYLSFTWTLFNFVNLVNSSLQTFLKEIYLAQGSWTSRPVYLHQAKQYTPNIECFVQIESTRFLFLLILCILHVL